MDQIVIGELTARFQRAVPGSLVVELHGRSASRDASAALAPLFSQIVSAARVEERGVVLRFEALEYFNSSTIAALVQLIRNAQEAGVALEIVYDGRQRWQALSFDALRRALRPLESAGAGAAVTFRAG
jgi:hypothetical protein